MKKLLLSTFTVVLATMLTAGCTMHRQDAGMIAGGVVGGAAGAALTDSPAGAVVGAVGGAFVGRKLAE